MDNHKIIYVAREVHGTSFGGSVVAERNLASLQNIFGKENVKIFRTPKTSFKTIISSLIRLGSYGIPYDLENNICKYQKDNDIKYAFIEGTLASSLIKKLSKQGCITITFAHNVEKQLYQDRCHEDKTLVSNLRYFYVKRNEQIVMKYSSKIIALNDRDATMMKKIYNRYPDIILPITFPDNIPSSLELKPNSETTPYLLFVGSDFFPNVSGIKWFIENVSSDITNFDIIIAGGCCNNKILQTLELPQNVHLLGYIDDISTAYLNASAVIAPIFSGSGMKTKTIEAMSYGKSIFGTSEAFTGITGDLEKIGGLCNTANEYISKIKDFSGNKINKYTQTIFRDNYTHEIFTEKLKQFLL